MAKSKPTPRKPTRDKGGRPRNGTAQRSIRIPETAWLALDTVVEKLNYDRDPLLDAVNVTTVINMAVRDLLEKHSITGGYPRAPANADGGRA